MRPLTARYFSPALIFLIISFLSFLSLDYLKWKEGRPEAVVFSLLFREKQIVSSASRLTNEIFRLLKEKEGPSFKISQVTEHPFLEIKLHTSQSFFDMMAHQLEEEIKKRGWQLTIKKLQDDGKESLLAWAIKDQQREEAKLLFQVSKSVQLQKEPIISPEKPTTPLAEKAPDKPKMAVIIIDDLGNNLETVSDLIVLSEPLTVSVLPFTPFAQQIADIAVDHGLEVLLHLPLESINPQGNGDSSPVEINSRMSTEEIISTLRDCLTSLPQIKGVNNHMGSLITQNREIMKIILTELKARELYFIDSRTSEKSIAYKLAAEMGLVCGQRDIFLDNNLEKEEMEKQVRALIRLCQKNRVAIAIAHPYPETIRFLPEALKQIKRAGIKIVPASQVLRQSLS